MCIHMIVDHVSNLMNAIEKYGTDGILESRYQVSDESKKAVKKIIETTSLEEILKCLSERGAHTIIEKHPEMSHVDFENGIAFEEMCKVLRFNTKLQKDVMDTAGEK